MSFVKINANIRLKIFIISENVYDTTYPIVVIQISKTITLSTLRIEHRTKQLWKFNTTLNDSLW